MKLNKLIDLQQEDNISRGSAQNYKKDGRYVKFIVHHYGKPRDMYIRRKDLLDGFLKEEVEYLKGEASRQLIDSLFINKE